MKPALVCLIIGNIMNKLLLSTAMVFSLAGAAFADTENAAVPGPVLSGEVSLDFTQDANNDWGGAMGLDLGVDVASAATVDLDFSAVDGGNVTLDNYTVGTEVNGVGVAFGDDNGLMPGAEGEQTLAAPAMAESLKVTIGDASVAVGFADFSNDVTDLSNVQGAYTVNENVTVAGDFNLDTDNVVLGAGLTDVVNLGEASLGGAVTYDVDGELFAFEGVANVMGATVYANGDQDDAFQNVGGEYSYSLGGAKLTAGANYNLDTEDFAPTASVSFAF